jgi:uncharacterized protein (UPF0332 family)
LKLQTASFLDKARELLERADAMLNIGLNEDAGRTAYLAGFHAAQALIFETTGRLFKKHASVQREFARLVKEDLRFDVGLRAFLPRAYNLKAVADYETGPRSRLSAVSSCAPSLPGAGSKGWRAIRNIRRRRLYANRSCARPGSRRRLSHDFVRGEGAA